MNTSTYISLQIHLCELLNFANVTVVNQILAFFIVSPIKHITMRL